MIDILGYVLFLFAGLFFGLFGSGGSIIIIPILIYIFKFPIYDATTYSLLLVLLISIFGTLKHMWNHNFHIGKIGFFIIPTLFFTSISRVFLFPNIPEEMFFINLSKDSFLMFLFSVVIFTCGISVLIKKPINVKYNFKILLFFLGLLVGTLTGILGIGGGFIILPALVVFTGMHMKKAVSSTLFIIMLNTLLAIILEVTVFSFQFDWILIGGILISSLIGVILGIWLLSKININMVKKIFSISLLLLSLVIFIIELL